MCASQLFIFRERIYKSKNDLVQPSWFIWQLSDVKKIPISVGPNNFFSCFRIYRPLFTGPSLLDFGTLKLVLLFRKRQTKFKWLFHITFGARVLTVALFLPPKELLIIRFPFPVLLAWIRKKSYTEGLYLLWKVK